MEQYEKRGKADALWYAVHVGVTSAKAEEMASQYYLTADRSSCHEVQTYCRAFARVMTRLVSERRYFEAQTGEKHREDQTSD